MNPILTFSVVGMPVPGGSKKAWIVHKAGCPAARRLSRGPCVCAARVALQDAAGERNKQWRYKIAAEAQKAMQAAKLEMLDGPLKVEFLFLMPRPKGHYNKQGIVRNSAPKYPCGRPDALKLARAAEDALSKVLWNDDCQNVTLVTNKRYAQKTPGVIISVLSLKESAVTQPCVLTQAA